MDAVVITIAATRGSVPGKAGAKAVVTRKGEIFGNLGGGKVEAKAAAYATELLGTGLSPKFVIWNLQRDVDMTCGGEMSFLFELLPAVAPWQIVIFGAGHVCQALVPVLATLDCVIDVIDPRVEWLARFPSLENVRLRHVASVEEGVEWVRSGSFVVSITQGHSSDVPVLRETLLRQPDVAFLGVIGSASKRAVLMKELRATGVPEPLLGRIVCPLGLPIGGNDPAEIAISIAAQLLAQRDSKTGLQKTETGKANGA